MDERRNNMFTELVLGLQSSAWMLMGKVANPATGQLYKNLQEANRTIDLLMMLELKTKGNLTETEAQTLKSIISQLQINYVEELKLEEKKKSQPEETNTTETEEKTKKTEEKKET
jgi:hypothetical protein